MLKMNPNAFSTRRILLAIILLAVLLRVAVALYLGDTTPPGKDETSYSTLALRLATGHGYSFPIAWYPFAPADAPTAHWSFLYTAFLAAVYAVVGAAHPLAARLLQAVLTGILMPWLTYRLARRVLGGNAVPLLAALLSAVYAYFILFDVMVQTEAFFLCAVLWTLDRALAHLQSPSPDLRSSIFNLKSSIPLGLSLGIATLLRQSILPWIAVMLLYLLVAAWRSRRWQLAELPKVLWPLVISGVVLIACIAPFTLRNYRVYGQFLLLNSNAGYAMYSAQHPLHGADFQAYAAAPLPADLINQGLNEAQWDKALMARGIGFVLADPGRYLRLSLSRVADYFEFWPTADSSLLFNVGRLVSFTLFLPFMLAGITLSLTQHARARQARARPLFNLQSVIFLLTFMAVYSLLHIFTWAMSRYRLPVDAVALPFAALALMHLWNWLRLGRLRLISSRGVG